MLCNISRQTLDLFVRLETFDDIIKLGKFRDLFANLCQVLELPFTNVPSLGSGSLVEKVSWS